MTAPRTLRRGAARRTLGALLLALLFATCGRSSAPPNVLFISIDTLRVERLGCYGHARPTSPAIDAFAAAGARFEHAFAQRGSTWPSLTSVLTGKYPITHGVRENGDMLDASQRTLPEMLQERGYRTAAFLTNMVEAPNRGFHTIVDTVDHALPQNAWDEAAERAVCAWLAGLQGEQPFFAWVHYMDPHKPYSPPPPYDRAFDPDYDGAFTGGDRDLDDITLGRKQPSERDMEHVLALYDGQILSTDRRVGAVLEALERSGRAQDTLVVLFSDHGEELCDHQRYFFHACSVYDGVLRIALALRWPGRVPAGRTVAEQVQEIDVLPTVLELLDLPAPADVEGESLVGLLNGSSTRADPHAYGEYFKPDCLVRSIRDGRWKLVYNPDGCHPRNPPYKKRGPGFVYAERELYDLASDPREQRNVVAEHPEVAARLERALLDWYEPRAARPGTAGAMDEETLESMQALGYVDADEGK